MGRFVRLLVAGGVVLVAGLWLVALSESASVLWLIGLALATLGTGGLGAGIASELETA
jgi:dipeptide/tripeptide permease